MVNITGFCKNELFIFEQMKEKNKKGSKCLCKYSKKDISENLDFFISAVLAPRFICTKCARSSNKKEMLCHASKISFSDDK